MDLSIIIVNYNVKEFLQNLIYSIQKASQNLKTEIIIVDNASDDGSVEFIKEKFPFVNLIANKTNLGFSKANNIGLRIAKGKYILLINPDTIVQENTFTELICFFEKQPESGMLGCKILNPDGTLQLPCRRSFPGPWVSFCKVIGLSNMFPKSKLFAKYNLTYLDENETYEVDAISGSFMMVKQDAVKVVGNLDEIFFMYGEDLDWCYRFKSAGYKIFYVHSTQIIHYKGESTKRSSIDETKIFYNAMDLFVKKHFASSFLIEIILHSAISIRKFITFLGRQKLILFSILLDSVFFNLSLFASEKIYMSIKIWNGFQGEALYYVYSVPVVFHIIISSLFRVYNREVISVFRNIAAVVFSFFFISSLTFFFKEFAYSRAVVIINFALLIFVLSIWRIIAKLFFKVGLNFVQNKSKTIIVGIDSSALDLAKKLKQKYTSFHSVIGLISNSRKDIGIQIENFHVVGSIDNIKKIISENKINEVIFSSNELSYSEMMSIVASCKKENVEFKLAGNNLDFLVGKTSVTLLDDIPIIDMNYNISNLSNRFLKRTFDLIFSTSILIFVYSFISVFASFKKEKKLFTKMILDVPKVLLGKFSFVGPKNEIKSENLFYGKKGITGLWFTESEDKDNDEKLNIFYAKNQNIWLDIEIIGKTINKFFIQ